MVSRSPIKSSTMGSLPLFLIILLPGAAWAQEGFLGILGGRTAVQLPYEVNHFGAMAGAYFQVDLSPHVGVRSEASWTRTGALARTDLNFCHGCIWKPTAVDLDYAELNVTGRLSWAATSLLPLNAVLGFTVFGGGWLGARVRGRVAEEENRVADFGQLLGLGVSWTYERLMVEVSARSYHGERGLVPGGPKRRGSQLALGLGYRVHPGGEG